MNIKEIAEKYIWSQKEAWMKGNADAFDEAETEDIIFHMIAQDRDSVGLAGHKQYHATTSKEFTILKTDTQILTAEGNVFTFLGKSLAVSNGLSPRWPPAGKEFPMTLLYVCRVKKGKVCEVWVK